MGQQTEDSVFEQLKGAAEANRLDKIKSLEHLKIASRDRLLKIIEKKICTTMIGALASVEDLIGKDLWGHGKPERECTPEQILWRDLWNEKVRPAILNNGNSQLRAMQAEVLLYSMIWNGYQNTFRIDSEQRKE